MVITNKSGFIDTQHNINEVQIQMGVGLWILGPT
jgi:hypothetical protein